MEAIKVTRQDLLHASESILTAITQLDVRLFSTTMSDKLGDMDEAAVDLDFSRRHDGDPVTRGLAITRSAGALADILRLADTKAYPVESLVLHISQILLGRLMILREADPGFCSTHQGRDPIEASISLIRSAAAQIEALILEANVVQKATSTRRTRRQIPPDEGGGFEWIVTTTVKVSYSNVSGSSVFHNSVSTEDPEDATFQQAVSDMVSEASAVRERGLAEDLANAAVSLMRGIADQAEAALRQCEMKPIGMLLFGRELTFIERAQYKIERRNLSREVAILGIAQRYLRDSDFAALAKPELEKYANELLNKPLNSNEVEALLELRKTFGTKSLVQLLLGHNDCKLK